MAHGEVRVKEMSNKNRGHAWWSNEDVSEVIDRRKMHIRWCVEVVPMVIR